jgi:RNA polymerase sigma factor (sigma-70 family)
VSDDPFVTAQDRKRHPEGGSVNAIRFDAGRSDADRSDAGGTGADRPESVADAAAREFAAWRDGDATALDRLVRLLTPVLWHLVRAYGLERQTAEDVVQATWLALFRHGASVRDPQAVVRWATTTARREAWRASRVDRREDTVETEALDRPDPSMPDERVLARRDMQTLWRNVRQLSERCQRLLRVIAFDERPDYASLSLQLGMPLGGVGPTRRRCLDKLRDRLADDPEWSDR